MRRKRTEGQNSFQEAQGQKEKKRAYLLQTLRMKSILTPSHPNLHLKRRITQKMRAVIPRG